MKVVYVSPTYFEPASVIGGGERYPLELARAMSREISTELISFSDTPRVEHNGSLTVRLFKPWCYVKGERISPIHFGFVKALQDADVIHCFQYHTWSTSISALWGRLHRKKIFVTDLGGGGWDLLSYHGGTWRLIDGFFHISNFAAESFKQIARKHFVVYGGIDTTKFYPLNQQKQKRVLFVGRLLPHKGIHILIRAIDRETPLTIIGRNYLPSYYEQLQELSSGKNVEFKTEVSDDELLRSYNDAALLVMPSLERAEDGSVIGAPELLGLAALEAMACKTPVIVSSAGSLPEIVEHEKTGLVFPSGAVDVLRDSIQRLLNNPDLSQKLADEAHQRVREKFSWNHALKVLLSEYNN